LFYLRRDDGLDLFERFCRKKKSETPGEAIKATHVRKLITVNFKYSVVLNLNRDKYLQILRLVIKEISIYRHAGFLTYSRVLEFRNNSLKKLSGKQTPSISTEQIRSQAEKSNASVEGMGRVGCRDRTKVKEDREEEKRLWLSLGWEQEKRSRRQRERERERERDPGVTKTALHS
jgi:hypothetical protein